MKWNKDLSSDQNDQVRDLNRQYGDGELSGAEWREKFEEATGQDPMNVDWS